MWRCLHLFALTREQGSADCDAHQKNREERDAYEALVSRRCRTDTPQLLVQQFLVTLIHCSKSSKSGVCKRARTWWSSNARNGDTFLRHPRACRGHPDSAGWPCLPLEITDKPGDDLQWISCISLVMAGLVPAIHVFASRP